MKKKYLSTGWLLCGSETGPLTATVPGCVHTDLLANGILEELYWRDNNERAQWIEKEDWVYTCYFDAEIGGKISLVFEGLDTYATIQVNGHTIGQTDDMFIPYAFDVSELLREKENELCVSFSSPIKKVAELPFCEGAFSRERMRTRRIQCTYGWDWVDRFVTCGICRPVYLRYENDMYVDNAYIYTASIDAFGAQLVFEVNFKNEFLGSYVCLEVIDSDGTTRAVQKVYVRERTLYRRIDIADPKLWYPSGYGEQPLYTLKVTCGKNVFFETFGIRTLKVVQLPDADDSLYAEKAKLLQKGIAVKEFDKNKVYSGFQVVVNGQPIFCQGANWVPCEPFPSAETEEKYKDLIAKAKQAGINTLRVWGGGIFEKKEFYDACDREGILVIQDFLMACGSYPEEEGWFLDRLRSEAAFAAVFLRNHPCLAFWQGDNENATLGADTLENFKGRTASLTALQPIVAMLDPIRSYMISSPYGGELYASLTAGTTHNTNYLVTTFDYFNHSDCKNYKDYFGGLTARFINEEPIFGAAELSGLKKFLTDEDIFEDTDEKMLRYHSKSNPCLADDMYDTMKSFAFKILGTPKDPYERQFKYRYLQYEWMRVVFENARRNLGYCNGILFWMYDDCWPAALGWSMVDYYGMPKAGYYCFKRMAKAVVGSITEVDRSYRFHVSNASNREQDFSLRAYRLNEAEGYVLQDCFQMNGKTAPYSVFEIILPWETDDNALVICDLKAESESDRSFYKRETLPLCRCNGIAVIAKSETEITLKADRYIHAVSIESDDVLSENYFSMLSNELKTIRYPKGSQIGSLTAYTLL